MAYGFVIDLEKCVGCHGCSVACKGANGTPPTVTRSRVDRGTEGSYPNAVRTIPAPAMALTGSRLSHVSPSRQLATA